MGIATVANCLEGWRAKNRRGLRDNHLAPCSVVKTSRKHKLGRTVLKGWRHQLCVKLCFLGLLEEENDVLLAAARRFDQRGGNPIFRAIFTAAGRNRSFLGVVHQKKYRLTFQQLRPADENEPLGEALTEAIRQGLEQVVQAENTNPAQYSLLLAIHSNSVTNSWAQSARHVPLNEWLHNREYARSYLEQLARKLNSAQVVDPERDGFFVELTFVKTFGRGGKNGGKKGNPGNMAWEKMAKKKKCVIQIMGRVHHVRNGGEVQVLTAAESYYVDGFDEETNTVFGFYINGCWYNGCPHCFKHYRDVKRNSHQDRTVNEVYDATLKKAALLRQAGYTVVEKWECVFRKEKKTDPELQAFLQELEMVPPLNPRDAFYGGRTGAVALHCKVEDPDLIKYADVTSLYPWFNKYMECPVRFPLIYTNPRDQDIHHYFGVAKVDILAPEFLFHPVLPYRAGGKLTFPLCAACVKEEQEKPWLERTNICCHTDQERALRGTWATIELQKAVQLGYRILKIHEVFHFR